MNLHIVLEDGDGADEARKAVLMMGLFLGTSVMAQVAGQMSAQLSQPVAPAPAADDGEVAIPTFV